WPHDTGSRQLRVERALPRQRLTIMGVARGVGTERVPVGWTPRHELGAPAEGREREQRGAPARRLVIVEDLDRPVETVGDDLGPRPSASEAAARGPAGADWTRSSSCAPLPTCPG